MYVTIYTLWHGGEKVGTTNDYDVAIEFLNENANNSYTEEQIKIG